jgi:CheY-like chemotaxis protein/anti-sigma regulatory factor (Ser/Thr protein kinase)
MTKVLIVDDSPVDRRLAGKLLERRFEPSGREAETGLVPIYAANGREALALLESERPEVIVTDLMMPEMNGLDLVLEVRARYPLIPLILMTAQGSEDLAVRALQGGAASYVSKRDLAHDLLDTVEAIIETAQAKRGQRRLMECLQCTESDFVLENDPNLIAPLVAHLKDNVFRISGSDATGLIQVTIALREALLNAMEHGNLELDASLRERDPAAYERLADERRRQKPYAGRRVHVHSRETPQEATWVIRDEGPGFDTSHLPDAVSSANLEDRSGRGLRLIRTFMNELRFNDRGNEITLVRRTPAGGGAWDLTED